MLSKEAVKIDEIFTVDLTLTAGCRIEGEDFVNFCCLLREHELYQENIGNVLMPCPFKGPKMFCADPNFF